jgi:hypothetical protein
MMRASLNFIVCLFMKNSRETNALLTKNIRLQPALHRTTGSSRIYGNNSCFLIARKLLFVFRKRSFLMSQLVARGVDAVI